MTQKVFDLCGTPRLSRRSALAGSSQFVFEKRLDKSHRPPAKPQKSEFERQLIDLKKRLKNVESFWSRVPYQMCEDSRSRPSRHIENKDSCWNGEEPGSYDVKVVEDGVVHQMENPEVRAQLDFSSTLLNEQKLRLSNLANVLKSAFRGGDIEWWDITEEDVMQDQGSGDYYGEYSDDEDGFSDKGDLHDDDEGTGHYSDDVEEEEDDIIVPEWTQNTYEVDNMNEKWNPWPKNPPTLTPETTSTTSRPSSGTSSVHMKNKLALFKAVITYLLPVATCYLGGFLTDTPLIFI